MKAKESDKKSQPTNNNPYGALKYSGMAFKILACILLGFWGGTKLDAYFNLKIPVFTLVLGLLGVVSGIYLSIKDFIK